MTRNYEANPKKEVERLIIIELLEKCEIPYVWLQYLVFIRKMEQLDPFLI